MVGPWIRFEAFVAMCGWSEGRILEPGAAILDSRDRQKLLGMVMMSDLMEMLH